MRKTGIYILLGITISLAIFVFAGIVYFGPVVQEMRLAEAAVAAEQGDLVVITPQVPSQKPAKVIEQQKEPEKAKEPVADAPVLVPAETAKTIREPEVVTEVETQDETVAEVPEEVQSEQEVPITPGPPRVPAPPVVRMTVTPVPVPEAESEPAIEQAVIEEPVIEEPVIEIPTVSQEPEVYDIPVYYRPPTPQPVVAVQAVLPSFTKPEPVEYVWTPTTVPEGPIEHVNPVTFTEEAFQRRQKAVEEVYDKLIWE